MNLAGRYEIGDVIGRGGMAEVRAGRDLRLRREVAVKTLLPELAGQPEIRRRFEREARAAARLTHPNVVAVYDVGEDEGVPFIVMERVPGPTLHEEMALGPFEPERARQIGAAILDALSAAHGAGIVHRDVKPGNVLVGVGGVVKVTDFGIAKAVDDDDDATGQVDVTTFGELVGTVAYMAPERLAGEAATVQADLYSTGVILYEALSGARPFPGDTPMAVAHAVQTARPPALAELRPDLDPALVGIVGQAMARRPEDRFTSAAEMAAALRAAPVVAADADRTVAAAPETRVLQAAPATIADRSPSVADPTIAGRSPSVADPERRGPTPRRPIIVVAAVLALAALLALAASGLGDENGSGSSDGPTGTTAVTGATDAGLPPPLADALDRLDGTLR